MLKFYFTIIELLRTVIVLFVVLFMFHLYPFFFFFSFFLKTKQGRT